jgi:hypothetical protein
MARSLALKGRELLGTQEGTVENVAKSLKSIFYL